MKRVVCLLLSVILMLGLFGCGADAEVGKDSSDTNASDFGKNSSVDNSSQTESDDGSKESTSSEEDLTVDDWRTHPEDFKLIALTY
ncbi:MAG: hypothetical protein J6Q76_08970, partial [Clostridia bacterium]|nr:hypothetical protein [Clostridia bacterium]